MKLIAIKSVLMRTVAVMLLMLGTVSASAQYYMNVVQKDGTKVPFLVSDIDSVYFSGQEGPSVNYEYVDLGLSVNWATFNVGATKPEEYGDYFAWGETEPYYEAGYAQDNPQTHWKDGKTDGYSEFTYKWCNGDYNTLTKYCNERRYGYNGFTDDKTILDPEDDVAHVKWGGSWRMPTKAEQDELRDNCTWTWYNSGNTEFNGVAGYKVTSKKEGYTDRSIFLPAAGLRSNTGLISVGSLCRYWSSSLYTIESYRAWSIVLSNSYDMYINEVGRWLGISVRPVLP